MKRDPFFAQCFTVVDHAARHCTRGCGCDADDLRQDVLERVLRKADLFQGCDPARLEHDDQFVPGGSGAVEGDRHAGRLAGAGWRQDDERRCVSQGSRDLRQVGVDG